MPVNLSIKNVPDEVVTGLRNRAARNQRSLNQELLDVLKQAAKDQAPVTIDVLLERAQRQKPALDETASKVLAARDAEHDKAAQRFQDLLAGPDDPLSGGRSGGEQ
jgi:antitoxin FitA